MSCISNLLFTCIPCPCDIKFYKQKKKREEGHKEMHVWMYMYNIMCTKRANHIEPTDSGQLMFAEQSNYICTLICVG